MSSSSSWESDVPLPSHAHRGLSVWSSTRRENCPTPCFSPGHLKALDASLTLRELLVHNPLTDALRGQSQGHADCARTLLSHPGTPEVVNATDSMGMTALHYASASGSEQIVEMLIDAGASLTARDLEGLTSLMLACGQAPSEAASTVILRLVVAGGRESLGAVDRFGANCLYHAASQNQSHVVRLLMRVPKEGYALARTRDALGHTPFLKACKYGHTEVVKALLDEDQGGWELAEAVDNQGLTALHLAVPFDDVVALLLSRQDVGSRIMGVKDLGGQLGLHLAFASCSESSARVMMMTEQGRRLVLEQDVMLPTFFYLQYCTTTKCAARYEDDLSAPTLQDEGFGILHHASFAGNWEMIRLLQSLPIDAPSESFLCMRDRFGRTCLHLAAARGHSQAALAILELPNAMDGGLLSALDHDSFSVLHHASCTGSAEVARMILQTEQGQLLVWLKGKYGVIPMHQAAGYGQSDVIKLLLEAGGGMGQVSQKDVKGFTALHHACFGGHQDALEVSFAMHVEAMHK